MNQESIILEYWRSGQGLSNITPQGKVWPEGEEFATFLTELLTGEIVAEIGCGLGRLAPCFQPDNYVGVDICPQAIGKARERHPDHAFHTIGEVEALPMASVALLHTVLLHVPDKVLPEFVARLTPYPRVVVGEILGRHWRREGNPPVFNRELEDYVEAFRAEGFQLSAAHEILYSHYQNTNLTVMDFQREKGSA